MNTTTTGTTGYKRPLPPPESRATVSQKCKDLKLWTYIDGDMEIATEPMLKKIKSRNGSSSSNSSLTSVLCDRFMFFDQQSASATKGAGMFPERLAASKLNSRNSLFVDSDSDTDAEGYCSLITSPIDAKKHLPEDEGELFQVLLAVSRRSAAFQEARRKRKIVVTLEVQHEIARNKLAEDARKAGEEKGVKKIRELRALASQKRSGPCDPGSTTPQLSTMFLEDIDVTTSNALSPPCTKTPSLNPPTTISEGHIVIDASITNQLKADDGDLPSSGAKVDVDIDGLLDFLQTEAAQRDNMGRRSDTLRSGSPPCSTLTVSGDADHIDIHADPKVPPGSFEGQMNITPHHEQELNNSEAVFESNMAASQPSNTSSNASRSSEEDSELFDAFDELDVYDADTGAKDLDRLQTLHQKMKSQNTPRTSFRANYGHSSADSGTLERPFVGAKRLPERVQKDTSYARRSHIGGFGCVEDNELDASNEATAPSPIPINLQQTQKLRGLALLAAIRKAARSEPEGSPTPSTALQTPSSWSQTNTAKKPRGLSTVKSLSEEEQAAVDAHEAAKSRLLCLETLRGALISTARLSCAVEATEKVEEDINEIFAYANLFFGDGEDAIKAKALRPRMKDIRDNMIRRFTKYWEPDAIGEGAVVKALEELMGRGTMGKIEREIEELKLEVQRLGALRSEATARRHSKRKGLKRSAKFDLSNDNSGLPNRIERLVKPRSIFKAEISRMPTPPFGWSKQKQRSIETLQFEEDRLRLNLAMFKKTEEAMRNETLQPATLKEDTETNRTVDDDRYESADAMMDDPKNARRRASGQAMDQGLLAAMLRKNMQMEEQEVEMESDEAEEDALSIECEDEEGEEGEEYDSESSEDEEPTVMYMIKATVYGLDAFAPGATLVWGSVPGGESGRGISRAERKVGWAVDILEALITGGQVGAGRTLDRDLRIVHRAGLMRQELTLGTEEAGCQVWIERVQLNGGDEVQLRRQTLYQPVYERTIAANSDGTETSPVAIHKPAWDEVHLFTSPVHANLEAKRLVLAWYGKFFDDGGHYYLQQVEAAVDEQLEGGGLLKWEEDFEKDGVQESMKVWVNVKN